MAINMIKEMASALNNLIKFCFISHNNNDDTNIPNYQVSYYGKTANALYLTPHGFYSQPPLNSLGVVWNIGGNESKLAVIANDYENRPKNLNPGECVVANIGADIIIKLNNDGVLELKAPNLTVNAQDVNVNASNVNVSGDNVQIQGDPIVLGGGISIAGGEVELAGGGAPVARVGDLVAEDPITGDFVIAAGSSNVTAG